MVSTLYVCYIDMETNTDQLKQIKVEDIHTVVKFEKEDFAEAGFTIRAIK